MISIYIDKNYERYKSKIDYSIDYIFALLGYSWKYIQEDEMPAKDEILFYYADNYPKKEVTVKLSQHCPLIFIKADKDFFITGAYTKDKLRKSIRKLQINKKLFPIISQNNIEHPLLMHSGIDYKYASFEFDIIGNTFFHLSEEETCWLKPTAKKKKKKSKEEDLFQFDEFYQIPYLNRLLLLLETSIQELSRPNMLLLKKSLWPQNAPIAFALSYNVNTLHKWKIKSFFITIFELIILLFIFKWNYFFRIIMSWLKFMISNNEPYWNFQEINEKEREVKARSTWFFHAKSNKIDNTDYYLDDYDLQDELKAIVNYGSEIAFLPTKKASETNSFENEYEQFSKILKIKKTGIRHLYRSNLSENSLILEREYGIVYDSTRESNKSYGFPSGVCTPYKVWSNTLKNKNKPIWEIPINFNEKSFILSKFSIIDFEKAKTISRELFAMTKEHKGLIHFSFDISSFCDVSYLYKLLSYILDQSNSNSAYKASLSQIIQWIDKRNNVKIKVDDNVASFTFPDDIDDFSVTFSGAYKFASFEGGNCSCKNKTIQFYDIKKDTTVKVLFAKEHDED
ncbi:MAG: hypothetical protein RBS16_04590 [Candidatus Cloacimonadales bacterium]|nr:hypothetical protein [Candidatus Cloacimonadota bacterium]MDD2649717.1 hypothetical protein [Candidatus Cloacimonadota bacterium]MDD3500804.1 hypothetical protein [Candidatus Cloacimonadota bacterium]MDX9977294.1 hypothetical protein [Candidatus Cloacimonadales bacterium]